MDPWSVTLSSTFSDAWVRACSLFCQTSRVGTNPPISTFFTYCIILYKQVIPTTHAPWRYIHSRLDHCRHHSLEICTSSHYIAMHYVSHFCVLITKSRAMVVIKAMLTPQLICICHEQLRCENSMHRCSQCYRWHELHAQLVWVLSPLALPVCTMIFCISDYRIGPRCWKGSESFLTQLLTWLEGQLLSKSAACYERVGTLWSLVWWSCCRHHLQCGLRN